MKSETFRWSDGAWHGSGADIADAHLVLVFGSRSVLSDGVALPALRALAPSAQLAGCSTAGEIAAGDVTEDCAVAISMQFDRATVRAAHREIHDASESVATGEALARELAGPDLRHVFVLSDGLKVNGTKLAAGLRRGLPPEVCATGGLAGDGADFSDTLVVHGNETRSGLVVALGFYGRSLRIGWGSAGGWSAFGPRRMVTRSEDNVLYTLDDKPALELYKRYLGERATGLPATGLLFPLELLPGANDNGSVVRTILAVNEDEQSLTFAGDVPQQRYVRLMKSSIDHLVGGAEQAAEMAGGGTTGGDGVALLVSCVGRRLVLGPRVEEEIEAVRAQLGEEMATAGFYSYGEIAPGEGPGCELHNQTMTLTTIAEGDD